ncbi:MAG: amidohydrolase [Planctomycetes bacterium]|nr:amidohydrolase [Planctomycetota bacterium]
MTEPLNAAAAADPLAGPALAALAASLAPEITALRRDLHAHPEIRYQEERTGEAVARQLAAAGLEVRRGLAQTGLLGVLHGARPGGRCVALRADLDALPITEETGLPYASTRPGAMHACGHDGHTATLVGVARLLAALRDRFAGTVKFLFQPAEEGGHGGLRMCEAGVLADPPVDAIFALHSWPFLPAGSIGVRYGPMMAGTDTFAVDVIGQGGHAAYPHRCVDPILIACRIVDALQSIVSREVGPADSAVITVGKIAGGTAVNIIPNRARLEGTLRSLREPTRQAALASIRRIAEGVATAHRGRAEVVVTPGYPPTVNHDAATELVRAAAVATVGPERVSVLDEPSMGGEDFAYYLERVPGCMFRLGVARGPIDHEPTLHTTRFDFNDAALEPGMRVLAASALRMLADGLPDPKKKF